MPSIRYINQTAPFWDFVASLENNGSHPFLNNQERDAENRERDAEDREIDAENRERDGEFTMNDAWAAWSPWHRGMPFHPHPRGPHGRHRGPPPPGPPPPAHFPGDHPPPPPPAEDEHEGSPDTLMGDNEKAGESGRELSGDESERRRRGGPHRHGRRGSPFGGRGRHGPPGAHGHRGPHGPHGGPHGHRDPHGRGGPWGHGRGRGGPFGGFGGPWGGRWAEFLGMNNNENDNNSEDFKPEADIFDTENNYVVHLSLAGAKKEDIGVAWDPEKSELSVTGVIHRPGDEEFLKTLALDERRVGAFERKVRLGSRANPAQIDVDGITAKLVDGVLVVEVPKLDKDYVEIRKVDIE